MLVSLTVGKVDAGVAVLLTEDKRLVSLLVRGAVLVNRLLTQMATQIEFPSILLPPDIHSGSIVDINVARNQHAELLAEQKFNSLQNEIFTTFGTQSPSAPVLRCRNATQTSIVLEWDTIDLATASLRSLSLYRNGTKAGVIPKDKLSTKISGLAVDTDYTFHLVLRTSAGQYSSERLTIRTHKMTNLTGITITPGIMPSQLKDSLAETVHNIGARLIDTLRIDTTHFVCTEPRGANWEKAVEMNVPVVVPDWIKGCEREGRIVGVRGYYLDADPKHRQIGPGTASAQVQAVQRLSAGVENAQQQQQQQPARDSPRIEHTPPTPERATRERAPVGTEAEAPTPPPKFGGNVAARDGEADGESVGGATLVSKEADGDEDEDDDGATEKLSRTSRDDVDEQDENASQSRMPLEQEEGRDVVAEQEAMGDDGKFDEVAL